VSEPTPRQHRPTHPSIPPEAWLPARRLAETVRRPIERFLHVEASAGILLLAAAAIALVWANSPWHESYETLWHAPLTLGLGPWTFTRDIHFWINDGLMTVFFLVVGLEIKREIVEGALSDFRRAALSVAGALGGMLVPAGLYLAINGSGPGFDGWGVPMATDIAFAVGVLTLLGNRVAPAMRILLLAIAIIDDIGAILVIAVFYSSGFSATGLLIAAVGLVLLLTLQRLGTRPGWISTLPLVVIWVGMYTMGVHPTIAGVIVGLAAPVRSWVGSAGFLELAREALDDFQDRVAHGASDHELLRPLERMAFARREAVSPAIRIESALHPWVAYGIMPLFALANAGVHLSGLSFSGSGSGAVLAGIILGLAVGKPAGVLFFSWLAVRLGLCVLPAGIGWRHVFVLGSVAGIGFTMAIFIAELAFVDPAMLGMAKLAVLIATGVAAAIGLGAGVAFLGEKSSGPDEPSDAEVEAWTAYWKSPDLPAVRKTMAD
jgi:NhaA family Na+:H+ antiporter